MAKTAKNDIEETAAIAEKTGERTEIDKYFETKKAEFEQYAAGVAAGLKLGAAGIDVPVKRRHARVIDDYSGDEWTTMVSVTLFQDSGKYKNDLFVSVNGKRYQIQRGVPVTVPLAVAKVIAQSQNQDVKTAMLIRRLADESRILD